MTPRAKTIMLAFTLVSVLAAPFAEAARLGGGKSAGMRRSAPTSVAMGTRLDVGARVMKNQAPTAPQAGRVSRSAAVAPSSAMPRTPDAPVTVWNQENKLMYPAPFSPMQ